MYLYGKYKKKTFRRNTSNPSTLLGIRYTYLVVDNAVWLKVDDY